MGAMILLIIFGLLFLIGISFFAAAVGTSFLRKRAVRVLEVSEQEEITTPPSAPETPGMAKSIMTEEEYMKKYQEGYREQLSEIKESIKIETPPPPPAGVSVSQVQPAYTFREPAGGGRVAIVVIAVLIVFGASLYFGMHGFKIGVKPRLYFAESIDFSKLKPVRKSTTFTRGNVTLFVRSKKPLGLDGARIEVYKMSPEGFDLYTTSKLPLKPEWNAFTVKVLFDSIGSYLVTVTGKDGTLIAQKNITIVPDIFAYKPVAVKK
jgi:hypothetical protein